VIFPQHPRLRAPAVAATGSAFQGISAFAFQGTNAHVIVSTMGCQPSSIHNMSWSMWRMTRMWYGVRPNHLLTVCKRAGPASVTFACYPATRKTLHDHVVSGRIILPATAMIEIFAAASGALSLHGAVAGQVERCPAVALAAIHRAVILGRKGQFDTMIEVTVVDGSLVLQDAGGSLVAEATSRMARREERTARKIPMRDRLYQQFIAAAGRVLGSLRQYMGGQYSQQEHVPISFLDRAGVSDDGCLLVPELADAATHIQAAGQSQGRSTLYLPSTIDFCALYSTEGDSIRANGLKGSQ
jgi:hypothetical protein